MAAGDLYIVSNANLFKRAAGGNTWTRVSSAVPLASDRAATVDADGKVYVAAGTQQSPAYHIFDGSSWTSHSISGQASIQGIGIDAEGTLYFLHGESGGSRLFTDSGSAQVNVTPALPNDPLVNIGVFAVGLSVNQKNGNFAICGQKNVWERASDATTWTELTIPTTVVAATSRNFQSVCYDEAGRIWVYNVQNGVFYNQDGDGNWNANAPLPTSYGGVAAGHSSIQGTAFDQGRGKVDLLKLGADTIKSLKIGTDDVSTVYLGDVKVWE